MTIKARMLVTGGSGYLGAWVVRKAYPDWDVTATFFSHPEDELPVQPGVTWRRLDVRDRAVVAALVARARPAVLVHTAAANPGADADFEEVNGYGTHHVADAAAAEGARLIHVSSDVVFDGDKGNYVEEDLPAPITPYGRSKALAEEQVRKSGAKAVIVRTSLIYGWRPHMDRQTRWIAGDTQTGKPVHLFTDEIRCPIWVESLAAALVELARMHYTGVLHVAGAQALSRYEFGVRLLRFHGRMINVRNIDPDPSLVIPTRSRESGMHRPLDCTLDCSRARALLRTPLPGVDEVLGRGRDHDDGPRKPPGTPP